MARTFSLITLALALIASLAAVRSAGVGGGLGLLPLLLLVVGLLPIGPVLRLPAVAAAAICYLLLGLNYSAKGPWSPADVFGQLSLAAAALAGAIHLLLGLRPLGRRSRVLVMAGSLVVMGVLAFALVYAVRHVDMSAFS